MPKTKLTHGDFRSLVTTELYAMLEKVVNSKATCPDPYYIQVRIADDYKGPAIANAVRQNPQEMKDVHLEGKQVIHTRLVIFSCSIERTCMVSACNPTCRAWMGKTASGKAICPLSVPQLGTILFRMDNKIGKLECVYALPKDQPHAAEDSDNYGDVSSKVLESAKKAGVPLIWN